MREAYHYRCAYLAIRIDEATGGASADHMMPKSKARNRVYEWSNYRLACTRVNGRKGVHSVIDPFEVEDGWFELEFIMHQVKPGRAALGEIEKRVTHTIDILGLNDEPCRASRRRYVEVYGKGAPLSFLAEEAPFIASELRRQGRLRQGDL